MFRNSIKSIFRNLSKHKTFSVINITGLAIGMAACFLIFAYVSNELSYDRYHIYSDRIFRLTVANDRPGENKYGNASPAMGLALKKEYPEIQAVTRLDFASFMVGQAARRFQEDNVLIADSSLFSIFSFPLATGNPNSSLTSAYSVVLSETAAKKYFGSSDPVGKSLLLDWNQYGKFNAKVTAVMKDIPENSQFRADIILSMATLVEHLEPQLDNCWTCPKGPTYLLVAPGFKSDQFQSKLNSFSQKNQNKFAPEDAGHMSLVLEPLRQIYLHGLYPSPESGNINNVYIFSVIGTFILVLACINFINLSTARAVNRAREVGIRKAIGASRLQLLAQFMGESLVVGLIAFVVASAFSIALIPYVNELSGKTIAHNFFTHPNSIFLMLGLAVVTSLISGLFPSLLLSAFRPISVLKGRIGFIRTGLGLRKALVVLQFVVSIVLIVGTIVIYLQLAYMRKLPLGFKKDNMLVIDFHRNPDIKNRIETIKTELKKIPDVLSASASSGIPNSGFEPANYQIENSLGAMEPAAIPLYMVDEDFFPQYQIELVAGRSFSKSYPTDFKDALVVNEAAVSRFGYSSPMQLVGKKFSGEGDGRIIGVVKNFNFTSLHQRIEPLIFRTFFLANRYITLNISSRNTAETIARIEEKWKQLAPQQPFSYFFLDEDIDKQYKSESNFGRLFLCFGVLALVISNLGLFGLALFNTVQRTREIGIRKVLGASARNVVSLLSTEVIKLLILGFAIGFPIAWILMNNWLADFAYHIVISWTAFLSSALSVTAVSLLTISVQTIKAAQTNPTVSLRSE